MSRNDKAALRHLVRACAPGREALMEESRAICCHVAAWEPFLRAKVVGGYMPMGHEADITPLLRNVLERGASLALPRCGRAPEMTFHLVDSLDSLVPGRWGIPEPPAGAPAISPEVIDLLLTPLEAISSTGMRLGKGGGYYDRLLRGSNVFSLGVALTWQWREDIPCEMWDQPLRGAAEARGIRLF